MAYASLIIVNLTVSNCCSTYWAESKVIEENEADFRLNFGHYGLKACLKTCHKSDRFYTVTLVQTQSDTKLIFWIKFKLNPGTFGESLEDFKKSISYENTEHVSIFLSSILSVFNFF